MKQSAARYEKAQCIASQDLRRIWKAFGGVKLTSCPVQNMGHLLHGGSRASPSHVLKYGLRTISGRTGGVSVDASTAFASSAEAATAASRSPRIGRWMKLWTQWIQWGKETTKSGSVDWNEVEEFTAQTSWRSGPF